MPVQALEYARFLRGRGAGYDAVTASYQYGVAMFRDVLALELPLRIERRRSGCSGSRRPPTSSCSPTSGRSSTGCSRSSTPVRVAWHPTAADEVFDNPASQEAARRFRRRADRRRSLAGRDARAIRRPRGVRAGAGGVRGDDRGRGASDPELSRRLSLAETTVEFVLADDPDLSITLLLDRTPIEVHRDCGRETPRSSCGSPASTSTHLCSGEFKLAMAIARGRVIATGPVRKFLRVVPVLGHSALATTAAASPRHGRAPTAPPTALPRTRRRGRAIEDEGGFSAEQRELLDEAAEYRYHSGALRVQESPIPATSGRSSASTSTRRSAATASSTASTSGSPRG